MEIKKLNENYKKFDWDEYQFDYWEAFAPQYNFSSTERLLANEFLDMLKVDGEEECLITFRAAPIHMADLIINYVRLIQSKYQGTFPTEMGEDE
jgi:hypothetical protein